MGLQAADAEIVQTILGSDQALAIPTHLTASSTDSGMPQRFGIPAVTLGTGGVWRSTHSIDESFDSTDSHRGSQRTLAAVLAIAGVE